MERNMDNEMETTITVLCRAWFLISKIKDQMDNTIEIQMVPGVMLNYYRDIWPYNVMVLDAQRCLTSKAYHS